MDAAPVVQPAQQSSLVAVLQDARRFTETGDHAAADCRLADALCILADSVQERAEACLIAGEYLRTLSPDLEEPSIIKLILVCLGQEIASDPAFVPVVVEEISAIHEINRPEYLRIRESISNSANYLLVNALLPESVEYLFASIDVGIDLFNINEFVARELEYAVYRRFYELFQQRACTAIRVARSLISDMVDAGSTGTRLSGNNIFVAQLASHLGESFYTRYLDALEQRATDDRDFGQEDPTFMIKAVTRRRRRRLATNIVRTLDRKLRIALCVSGQLRGYRRASASWQHLSLEEHDTLAFVSVWRDIGRKFPIPQHADRTMSGRFLSAYREAFTRHGESEMAEMYPNLFRTFSHKGIAEPLQLSAIYNTTEIDVEDDQSGPFQGMSNYEKMYYKIKKCHEMAVYSGFSPDVIIRIRPDKEVAEAEVDWMRVFQESRDRDRIFVDVAPVLHGKVGYVIGDQFAAGGVDAMNIYSSSYDQTYYARRNPGTGFPDVFLPHQNCACGVMSSAFVPVVDHGIRFAALVDPDPIPTSDLLATILEDVKLRPAVETDGKLIRAAGIDLETH